LHWLTGAKWQRSIESLFSGTAMPHRTKNASPYSLQAELYLAAAFSARRFRVAQQEPDLVIYANGWPVAFAVKRVSAAGKVNRRISEAINQIQSQKMVGIVVLFVGDIATPREEIIFSPTLQEAMSAADAVTSSVLQPAYSILKEAATSPNILGIWAIGNCATAVSNFGITFQRVDSRYFLPLIGASDPRVPKLMTLVSAFSDAHQWRALQYWNDWLNDGREWHRADYSLFEVAHNHCEQMWNSTRFSDDRVKAVVKDMPVGTTTFEVPAKAARQWVPDFVAQLGWHRLAGGGGLR